jgi:hypothetical protein
LPQKLQSFAVFPDLVEISLAHDFIDRADPLRHA